MKRMFMVTSIWAALVAAAMPLYAGDSNVLGLHFTVPSCLPACTIEHRSVLNQDSFIEKQVLAAIDEASTSIDFQQFTFSRPKIFRALLEAADRGVTVRGIVDAGQFSVLHDQCSADGCSFAGPFVSAEVLALSPARRLALLDEQKLWPPGTLSNSEKLAILFYKLPNGSGVKPQFGKNRLMHNKFVLVDRDFLINGSGNWSSTAMGINLENINVMNQASHPGEIAAFDCLASTLWEAEGDVIQKIRSCEKSDIRFSPAARGDGGYLAVVDAVKGSSRSIDISMHHLVHVDVITALTDAALRGVAVRVMLDDDDCLVGKSAAMQRMRDAGIQIQYMPTACTLFQLSHNKFGIFDDRLVVNGSANWSQAGFHKNYENFVTYRNAADVAAFSSFFARVWPMTEKLEACFCSRRDPACRERYCLGRQPH